MANNPYVNKVQLADGTTLIDISDTTAAAADVAQGKYFYDASGAKVQGTATGGGGGGWTLLASDEFTVNTSSTSYTEIDTIEVGVNSPDSIYLITVYDKSGKRNGYFYGSESFFVFDKITNTNGFGGGMYHRYANSTMGSYANTASSGYGVYCRTLSYSTNTGKLTASICSRYNATYSLTVNSNYEVKVYSCKWPNNVNPLI